MMDARVTGSLFGLAALTLTAHVAGQQPELSWRAPADCPQEAWMRERIRAITGPLPTQSRLRADGEITKLDASYRLKLLVRDGELSGERNITSESCADLAGAAAVALGLLLRSDAPLTERELAGGDTTSPPTPSPPPPAPPAPPEAQRPTPPPQTASLGARAQQARRSRWLLRVPVVSAELGPLPEASLGVGLGAGVAYGPWRVALTGQWHLSQTLTSEELPGYGADARRQSATLSASYVFRAGALELGPGATLALERVAAEGFGSGVAPRDSSVIWLSAGVGVLAALPLSASLALVAEAGGRAHTSRPVVTIDALGNVRRLQSWALTSALGLEWSF